MLGPYRYVAAPDWTVAGGRLSNFLVKERGHGFCMARCVVWEPRLQVSWARLYYSDLLRTVYVLSGTGRGTSPLLLSVQG